MANFTERTSSLITAPRLAFRRFSRYFGVSEAGLEELVKPEGTGAEISADPQINWICSQAQDALDFMTCKKRPDASFWGKVAFTDLSRWRMLWFFQTAFNREIKRVTPIRRKNTGDVVRTKRYNPKTGLYYLDPGTSSVRLLLTTENWQAAKAGDPDALNLLKVASIRSS